MPRPYRIHLLYAGGTFGMLPGPQGLTPAPDLGSRLLPLLPDDWLQASGIDLEISECQPPLDSSAMNCSHWFRLAAQLRQLDPKTHACILIQGTDTLAWSASALHTLLPDLHCSLLLTAAMQPLAETGSDALSNLMHALQQAIELPRGSQGICFNRQLLPPTRTRKFHSQSHQAFHAVESAAEHSSGGVWPDIAPLSLTDLQHLAEHFKPCLLRLPIIPGMDDNWLAKHLDGLDGLILEGLGSGNTPHLPRFFHLLQQMHNSGKPVGLVSQCWQGGVTKDYESAVGLHQAGVISLGQMTPETAETRLTLLLALQYMGKISFSTLCDFWPDSI
ncbi:asparaginase domain-containing protein [Marinospirillum alkaliphilum]|uniref:L-asparaginase n=1 Tax=Marinospirillum alkaliphilum DSM 21637 TaxID=1122209 RepID=A0A1K1U481_9GAMM|nr:asparaginase domain-containing protein [Marinospirillum alkaliphilum]SFX07594.1 L-asparaginase [Marinospirillum alkaliphilum DSM 21637]